MVLEHHILGFEAGREVTVMDMNGEVFVELIGNTDNDAALVLPQGAALRTIGLDRPIIVHLPAPTTTHFWFGKGRSFQGPVDHEALQT